MKTAPGCHRAAIQSGCLQSGSALHLGECAGALTVLGGRAWLTLSNDPKDYFLLPGQRVLLSREHGAVIESAIKGQGLTYCWQPLRRAAVVHPDARQRRASSAAFPGQQHWRRCSALPGPRSRASIEANVTQSCGVLVHRTVNGE
jgi:hypothetical protein